MFVFKVAAKVGETTFLGSGTVGIKSETASLRLRKLEYIK